MAGILPQFSKEHIYYAIQELNKTIIKNLNLMQAQKGSGSDEYRAAEQEARESFAKMLKYYEHSMTTENKSLYDQLTPEDKERLDKEAKAVAYNKDVIELFDEDNLESTMSVMSADGETARKPDDIILKMDAGNRVKLATKQQELEQQRHRAKLLTGFLEKTGSRSFVGKLKSFFVGNSREYKEAIKSLNGFSAGTTSREDAIKGIKAYLNIRKNKVRDHQYGRDRFQGFMESLQTLMNPVEFKEYCAEVGMARQSRDKNYDPTQIQPERFSPTAERSVLKGLLENEKAVEHERALRETEAQARNRESLKQYENKAKEVFDEPQLQGPNS